MDDDFRRELLDAFGSRVRFDESLGRHTSFRIGGPADAWVDAQSVGDVRRLTVMARRAAVPILVLGGGSNVLVSDRGVRGIVLHLGRPFSEIEWDPRPGAVAVRAGAAVPFKKLVLAAIARGLAGLEFAEGIPGRVGGGLLMNAGAFGGEISDVVDYVEGVDVDGQERTLLRGELRFSYRQFDLPPGFIVTYVGFGLAPGDTAELRRRQLHARRRRHAVQPLGYANAGSVFKNPDGDYAGRLIEAAGLKGRRIGDAQISPEHANFIVNLGAARAADVRALMQEAIAAVAATTGRQLEAEIKLIGEW